MEGTVQSEACVGLQQQLGIPQEMFDTTDLKHPQRKSRAAKKRQKIEKRLKRFEDPEFRKAERQKVRKRQKEKLKSETVGMDKQQVAAYVLAKKQAKNKVKQKVIDAMKTGLPILIDAVYEEHMNTKERKSLGIQIELIYKSMRRLEHPCSLHICSLGSTLEEGLKHMRAQFWPITRHKQNVVEVGKQLGKKLIYLSPDGKEQLKQVSLGNRKLIADCAYVIGGLVDRTIIKNASYNRAQELEIESRRLPIDRWMQNRKCLNLDHVAQMLCKFLQTKDWQQAFEYACPKRFKKEGQEGEESEDDKQSSSDVSQSSNELEKQEELSETPIQPKIQESK